MTDDAQLLQPTAPAGVLNIPEGTNHGVILPGANEVVSGSNAFNLVLNPLKDWRKYITDYEPQGGVYFDSNGCVQFSGLHEYEQVHNVYEELDMLLDEDRQWLHEHGYFNSDGKFDASERFQAYNAHAQNGSSEDDFRNASEFGLVPQTMWDFPSSQRTPVFTKDDFYSLPTQNCFNIGAEYKKRFGFIHRTISTPTQQIALPDLQAALQFGPAKAFIGWGSQMNNPETQPIPRNSVPIGHAVEVTVETLGFGTGILDQYDPFKKTLAPDFYMAWIFQSLPIPVKGFKTMTGVSNSYFTIRVKPDGSKEFGFGDPATKPEALVSGAINRGLNIPMKPGVPDTAVDSERIDWAALEAISKKVTD